LTLHTFWNAVPLLGCQPLPLGKDGKDGRTGTEDNHSASADVSAGYIAGADAGDSSGAESRGAFSAAQLVQRVIKTSRVPTSTTVWQSLDQSALKQPHPAAAARSTPLIGSNTTWMVPFASPGGGWTAMLRAILLLEKGDRTQFFGNPIITTVVEHEWRTVGYAAHCNAACYHLFGLVVLLLLAVCREARAADAFTLQMLNFGTVGCVVILVVHLCWTLVAAAAAAAISASAKELPMRAFPGDVLWQSWFGFQFLLSASVAVLACFQQVRCSLLDRSVIFALTSNLPT
jgi:hypothetical protein